MEDDAPPARIYNIGNNRPEDLMHVVALLEKELGREGVKQMLPMQPGDVLATFADIDDLTREVGFRPADLNRGRRSRFCGLVS